MLFKPELNETAKAAGKSVVRSVLRRMVSLTITLLILGGLGYIGWLAYQPKQGGSANRGGLPRDLPVPVLAATPRVQDVPVYLDGVGSVRALNTVTVRAQVDGKLMSVNFVEGQDVRKGDVLAEIDPAIYQAQYDQAVAKKAQDEALLVNQKLDLARYQQLAASNAGSKQQADTQKARGRAAGSADQGRSGRDRQRGGDARLHKDRRADFGTGRPAPGRSGQHHQGLRCDGARDPDATATARGVVQPAAAADRAGQRRRRQGHAGGGCVRQ